MVPARCISRSDGIRDYLRDENKKNLCLKPQCLEPDIWYVASPKFVQIISPIFGGLLFY